MCPAYRHEILGNKKLCTLRFAHSTQIRWKRAYVLCYRKTENILCRVILIKITAYVEVSYEISTLIPIKRIQQK
jgi:hypothetical protein